MTTATYSRLPLVDPATASGHAKELLEGIQAQLGGVPNFMRALASSPAALEGFLGLNGKLHSGKLDKQIAERIALVTAETTGCAYCVSAHTALGAKAGLDQDEMLAARKGGASDPRAAAAVVFAKSVVDNRGDVTTAELLAVREAGLSDAEVVEIVTHVGLNLLTNFIGKVGQIEIDFPKVALLK